MKKLLTTALFLILLASTSFADNPGYMVSDGFVGIFSGETSHEGNAEYEDNLATGIIYYHNLINSEGGNLMIGTFLTQLMPKEKYFDNATKTKATAESVHTPIELNIAWSSASDTFNLWLGGGISMNFVTTNVARFDIADNVTDFYGRCTPSTQYEDATRFGTQLFLGMEKMFNKNWGGFIQWRHQYVKNAPVKIDATAECNGLTGTMLDGTAKTDTEARNYVIDNNISPVNSTISLGVTYHY